MICPTCNKDATDHHVAYYDVGGETPLYKCWPCLTPAEKVARLPEVEERKRVFRTARKTIHETP